ncbi:class I adenylate-forming enzyme family protein [[Mycobacterium] wendilense]|uniref:AMP-binding protein n=1 Tax=[Mycobacterium] wendilense TaxID=3064284 RepID=A0ABM9MET3_9MYCO|nr:AMP-binding protein [Mycolicibacterium sp. MU0050]CAJ1583482.1 AMP-binding protein [Mycolicibacterium sp. MU0050]
MGAVPIGELDLLDSVLSAVVERWAARDPDRVCIVQDDGVEVTYRELDQRASAIAAALQRGGVGAGDRVMTLVPNDVRAVYVMLGLSKIGAVEVPVNPGLVGASLRHVLQDAAPKAAIVDADHCERIEEALPGGTCGLLIGVAPHVDAPEHDPGTLDAIIANPGVAVKTAAAGPDTASIMYTSGTTGLPKGAVLPHRATVRIGERTVRALQLTSDDTLIAVLPLFHGGGKYMNVGACLISGARLLLVRKFSASKFWEQAREHRATVAHMVVSMAHFLLAQPESGQDRTNDITRALIVPAPRPLVDAFARRFDIPIFEMYGATEISIPILNSVDAVVPHGSCGRAVAPYRVRVVDEYDREVPPGEVGELCIRCDEPWSMSNGYWNQPEESLKVMRNFWFHTGDAARIDEDGYVYYVDRVKEMIRRRGENISPRTVEDVLNTIDGVVECGAYPVPSEFGEDEIAVAVVTDPGRAPSLADIAAVCAEGLPRFAFPRYIRFVDQLPKTETAKVQKFKLKQQGLADAVELPQLTKQGAQQ